MKEAERGKREKLSSFFVCVDVYKNWFVLVIPWTTAKLVQLSSIGEDDESNLCITKNGKLIGFLQKSIPSLCKCYLPVDLVLNSLQLNPTSPHNFSFLSFLQKNLSFISALKSTNPNNSPHTEGFSSPFFTLSLSLSLTPSPITNTFISIT